MWADAEPTISAAIDATDPTTALEHNLYVGHPNSLQGGHWGAGRVTLVGDVAHPVRPTGDSPLHLFFTSSPLLLIAMPV